MFRHGLRVTELCSIKLSDVDVDTKTFHVNRLKGCDSGELRDKEALSLRGLAKPNGPAPRYY